DDVLAVEVEIVPAKVEPKSTEPSRVEPLPDLHPVELASLVAALLAGEEIAALAIGAEEGRVGKASPRHFLPIGFAGKVEGPENSSRLQPISGLGLRREDGAGVDETHVR